MRIHLSNRNFNNFWYSIKICYLYIIVIFTAVQNKLKIAFGSMKKQ